MGVTLVLLSGLPSPGRIAAFLAACHDPGVAEIAGDPAYSDELLSLLGPTGVMFWPVTEGQGLPGDHRGDGFLLDIDFDPVAYEARFPSEMPLPIATVYYRLKGNPGDSTALTFCDGKLERFARRCNYNRVHTYADTLWDYLSTVNLPGTLAVVEGP
ncbi:MAG: hypothetical protein HY721_29020, partial [Planctomycetes bacterium]|nr:hypothetical protein [Planctomycetota bacterium]